MGWQQQMRLFVEIARSDLPKKPIFPGLLWTADTEIWGAMGWLRLVGSLKL